MQRPKDSKFKKSKNMFLLSPDKADILCEERTKIKAQAGTIFTNKTISFASEK